MSSNTSLSFHEPSNFATMRSMNGDWVKARVGFANAARLMFTRLFYEHPFNLRFRQVIDEFSDLTRNLNQLT